MIKDIRDREPFIHLGFNKQEMTIYKNEAITIWQDNIYNDNSYFDPFLLAVGAITFEVNRNYFKLYYPTSGSKTCQVSFGGTSSKFLQSNIVTINVVERTFGATDLFFGNETITFND